ncbi:hypothetical protein BLS_006107 [Venturia inaequalis]|uniref:NACHT domain-containing protein n=1 Tax=Venturia inaequalis TaxID=5025 RepID=A0A8H3UET6_VENIN|nr:hypothetical protein BLS_006107 [Venturia inaequalis]
MDPLSVLSVAANVIQVVDFSSNLIASIYNLYTSKEGEVEEYRQLRREGESLHRINAQLTGALTPRRLNRPLTLLELEVLAICTDCKGASLDLTNALNKVSFSESNGNGNQDEKRSKWRAVRLAVKGTWNESKIAQLQQRLERCRDLMTTSILVNLQQQVTTLAEQKSSSPVPENISWGSAQTIDKWLKKHTEETERWQKNLLTAVERSQPRFVQNGSHLRLQAWSDTPVARTLVERLMERMWYPEMLNRHNRIAKAFTKTFEWIFQEPERLGNDEEPWSNFREWLSSDSELYWITGKAGSGKSTLMKMIYNDDRTVPLLCRWSSNHPLVVAAFFFWNSGDELQMSQEGLLRSLLYQSLDQRRRIKGQSGGTWEAYSLSLDYSQPWSWDDLVQAFRVLIENDRDIYNYAFFIDGLDEFYGEKSDLIVLLESLASYSNMKLCISSRPWPVFEDAFNQKPSLMLQHRTSNDIKNYASQNLLRHPGFLELQQGNQIYAEALIENITTKASGVFLWVVLVVRSLIEGLTDGDRISDLQKRLDALPDELEQLFRNMLQSLKPEYLTHASQLFQLVRESQIRPTILTLSFADEEDGKYAFRRQIGPLDSDEIFYRSVTMKRRLDSRCKGLLEVAPVRLVRAHDAPEDEQSEREEEEAPVAVSDQRWKDLTVENGDLLAYSTVEYLHRTVKDFLEAKDIWDLISSSTNAGFSPNASLCRSYLLQIKTLSVESAALWDKIAWCAEYASRMVEEDCELHIQLLDALDQAVTSLTTAESPLGVSFIQRYWGSSGGHWTSTASGGSIQDTFLTFATRYQLDVYVDAKLDNMTDPSEIASRLLHTAVAEFGLSFFYSANSVPKRKAPLPALVKCLLHHGANPMYVVDGYTPCQRMYAKMNEEHLEVEGSWSQVIAIFQDRGVNVKREWMAEKGGANFNASTEAIHGFKMSDEPAGSKWSLVSANKDMLNNGSEPTAPRSLARMLSDGADNENTPLGTFPAAPDVHQASSIPKGEKGKGKISYKIRSIVGRLHRTKTVKTKS